MKHFYLLLGIFFGVLFLSPTDSRAQWEPDVRLTNEPAGSYTSTTNAWCIASSGDALHVVWYDDRDLNWEIYYKRSTDGGLSWEADTRLTTNASNSRLPSVAVSGSTLHVVWYDERVGNWEIYYKRSTDGGSSWGPDTRLTNDPFASFYPSVAVSGSVVHVVWHDQRDNSGIDEIYYKRSTDGGTSWGTDIRLTNNIHNQQYPSVTVSGTVVHIVWHDYRDGNSKIYYKRSTDGGTSWGTDTQLTNDSSGAGYPSAAVSGSSLHVVWYDYRDGNPEIYYKGSTDGGSTWGPDTRLTNTISDSWYSSVTASGSAVHVVWYDNRDGNYEIYYKRSTDGGSSWGADKQLTSESSFSFSPSVTASGSIVHVVWQDFRDGNSEIYYKRDPTGNVTGIEIIDSEIPKEFSLSQNYPNPFNPNTTIQFALPKSGFVSLKIYNLLGREVALLVNEEKTYGTYTVKWNASGMASGVYFYRMQVDSFIETRKLVFLR